MVTCKKRKITILKFKRALQVRALATFSCREVHEQWRGCCSSSLVPWFWGEYWIIKKWFQSFFADSLETKRQTRWECEQHTTKICFKLCCSWYKHLLTESPGSHLTFAWTAGDQTYLYIKSPKSPLMWTLCHYSCSTVCAIIPPGCCICDKFS